MRRKKTSFGETLFVGLFILITYNVLHDSFLLDRMIHHAGSALKHLFPLFVMLGLLLAFWRYIKDVLGDIFKF